MFHQPTRVTAMRQELIIAFLATALLAASIKAAPNTAVTVYVHNDQPLANMPVTATNGQRVVSATTDTGGVAQLALGAGRWDLETCGQSATVEMMDEVDGTPGMVIVGCHQVFVPVAAK